MSFKDKSIEEMHKELERVEREQSAKGRNHPDYNPASLIIDAIK